MASSIPGSLARLLADRRVAMRLLVTLALAARLAHLAAVIDTPVAWFHVDFVESDMHDFDTWARRIAAGDVLGRERFNPLHGWQLAIAPAAQWEQLAGETPVFFKAPLYPYCLALLHRLLGSIWLPACLLQILASTLGVALVYLITERLFGRSEALVAGAFFALYGPAVHFDVVLLRRSAITLVTLLATYQLMTLDASSQSPSSPPRLRASALLGLTAGAGLLLYEGLLLLPLAMAAVLAAESRHGRRFWPRMAAFAFGLMLPLSLLVARNSALGVKPLALAANGALVFATANSAFASPVFFQYPAPAITTLLDASQGRFFATALACLRSFGGAAQTALFYARRLAGLFAPFENTDNANLYYVALHSPLLGLLPRFGALFPLALAGLALSRSRWRAALPLFAVLLSLGLPLLLTVPVSRYRVTPAALLMPFAALALTRMTRWIIDRRIPHLAALALGLIAVIWAGRALETRVVFAGSDPTTMRYRAAEFLIGARSYARQDRYEEATREIARFTRRNPDAFLRAKALIVLAEIEMKHGRATDALHALKGARSLGRQNAAALIAVGDAFLALRGDREAARSCYERAQALDPSLD